MPTIDNCSGCPTAIAPPSLAMRTYADLASCEGESEQFSLDVADSFQGKAVAKIIAPSKDPQEILAAMGAYTREWSTGADSFTVFSFSGEIEAREGAYNRGRIFWNNGGPIDVEVCSTFFTVDASDGTFETCDERIRLTVENS